MTRDFTLRKYEELCSVILDNYTPMSVRAYLERGRSDGGRVVILRHDVDRSPSMALKMAKLESDLGISSTYYFRYPATFNIDIIKRVSRLGHEVGYHYECMGKARCDPKRAIEIFRKELEKFREIGVDVKTICAHGQPFIRCLNTNLWKSYDFNDFGILGEAFLSFEKEDVTYFSDTGRTWGAALFKTSSNDRYRNLKTTDDLIGVLKEGALGKVYILTHPERWSSNIGEFLTSLARDKIINLGKWVIKVGR